MYLGSGRLLHISVTDKCLPIASHSLVSSSEKSLLDLSASYLLSSDKLTLERWNESGFIGHISTPALLAQRSNKPNWAACEMGC